MPTRPLSVEKQSLVRQLLAQHPDKKDAAIARMAECCANSVRKIRMGQTAPDAPASESSEMTKDTWSISLPKTRIKTLEELVRQCDIDLSIWEVERFICNKWEMAAKVGDGKDAAIKVTPLFQVKAFLKKRKWVEEAAHIIETLRKKAAKHSPKYPVVKTIATKSGNVVEISPVDVHHGALIWNQETGSADYDLKLSAKLYRLAVTSLMARTDAFKPEKALLVLGHDQQNSDNRAGNTEAGTPQNNDGRYQKVFAVSCECSIWAIDACLLKYGEVEVVPVPGNHDALSTWHLGEILRAWYRNCPKVTIHNSPNPKKYWEFGVNMLMLTHGNKGKLENYDKTMAAEQPAMWGRTKWREAHTGDKHHRRTLELPGATVRILPSLRPPDAWTAENHYVGSIRAAEAYVWNRDEGLIGTATYSVLSS
jgi:hypothetical protein